MKFSVFLVLLATLFGARPAFAGAQLGGIFFVCSNDLDQERHFIGMSGHVAMPDEARRDANQKCDDDTGGVATHIVYVYRDGSQVVDEHFK